MEVRVGAFMNTMTQERLTKQKVLAGVDGPAYLVCSFSSFNTVAFLK